MGTRIHEWKLLSDVQFPLPVEEIYGFSFGL